MSSYGLKEKVFYLNWMTFELRVVLLNEDAWFSCTVLPQGSHLWEFRTQASGTSMGGRESGRWAPLLASEKVWRSDRREASRLDVSRGRYYVSYRERITGALSPPPILLSPTSLFPLPPFAAVQAADSLKQQQVALCMFSLFPHPTVTGAEA